MKLLFESILFLVFLIFVIILFVILFLPVTIIVYLFWIIAIVCCGMSDLFNMISNKEKRE